jgi:HD-GYP domain-containing protein (c-di-GMP phosphodiesterase class II)
MEILENAADDPAIIQDTLRFLSYIPLFYSLNEQVLERIARCMRHLIFQPEETVIQEGDPGDSLYILREGHVKVIKKYDTVEEMTIAVLDPGEALGEISLITRQPRSATIKAIDRAYLNQLMKHDFDELTSQYPELLAQFNKLITQRVSLLESTKDLDERLKEKVKLEKRMEVDLPTLELLINLNDAAGGPAQVEHCRQTANLAKEMSKVLCPLVSDEIFFAAYLHEVGKVSLSQELVDKERRGDPLSDEEIEEFSHIWQYSAEIFKNTDPNLYEQISFLESMGSLSYQGMPLEAQILKVADAYQEFVQYREMPEEDALELVKKGSGTHYNPKVVSALEKITQKFRGLRVENQIRLMKFLNEAVDLKDHYTRDHSTHTRDMALLIGERLELGRQDMEYLQLACELHDVGKIYIRAEILNAPRRLTDAEFEIMRSHAEKSARFFEHLPGLDALGKIVRAHHEKYDGTGYPDKLSGDAIPYLSRIMAVADVYSALTTPRVYRGDGDRKKVYSPVEALEIMRGSQPGHFDPEIFAVFCDIIENQKS